MTDNEKPAGLALLREPFKPHQISKLPKPTKKQTDDLKAAQNRKDFSLGVRCTLCGQWHHKDATHLDYVGHAAITDRLLDCDPEWNWEPLSVDERGQPVFQNGGMWIKLTVCGVTRLGFGDAEGKSGGNALKEIIGDAIRNAAMRFGAALDLWHKGELHGQDDATEAILTSLDARNEAAAAKSVEARTIAISRLTQAPDLAALQNVWVSIGKEMAKDPEVMAAKEEMKAALLKPAIDDEIPY